MSDTGRAKMIKQEGEEEGEIKRLIPGTMQGYNDSVISPQENNPSCKIGSNPRKRDQMSENFTVLESMVPNLFKSSKRPKESILNDTVKYINLLEKEVNRLEDLKKSQSEVPKMEKPVLSKCTSQNSSVNFTFSSGATFLAIQLPVRRALVLDIVKVLEKHRAEVLEARVSVNDNNLLTFTATVILEGYGVSMVDQIKEKILNL